MYFTIYNECFQKSLGDTKPSIRYQREDGLKYGAAWYERVNDYVCGSGVHAHVCVSAHVCVRACRSLNKAALQQP